MKTVRVVAAVICDSIKEKKQIFATERGYGEFKGQWEFPGGKIEEGETPQQAHVREIREELEASIRVGDLIDTIEYDYPTFHLSMDCFWAEIISGKIVLKEAESAKWLIRDELDSIQWLPADESLIEKIGAALNHTFELFSKCGKEEYFGRTIVEDITGLKSTRASELIKLLVDSKVIVSVTGHGKGKYRFQL